ncbi:MAG TPA: hypothetical protein VGZ24_02085, partial [Chthoniobacterales bacterium]|nr:hypothetical protein [Chthoniobacterales bacterium]
LAFTMSILSGRVEQDKAESALYDSLVLERTSIYRRYRQRLGVLSVEDSEEVNRYVGNDYSGLP